MSWWRTQILRTWRAAKWICIGLVSVSLLWFAASYVLYRVSIADERSAFVGEVHYKIIDLNYTNRGLFEGLLANRVLRLAGQPILYVSETDFAKLNPENPFEMEREGYTFSVKVTSRPLLFGGYGLAEIVRMERIEKAPIISK